MIATIVIASVTFLLIMLSLFFFPKIKVGKFSISTYWVIALVGAITLLASLLVPFNKIYEELIADNAINPIKILVLFFSMTLLSILLDEFGLFKYLASLSVKIAKNNQFSLFFLLYFLVAILTIFTSNDVVILTLTPFICFFCKRTHINPLPYLIAEFTAANTWSLMFLIGNPTNIFLATSAKINFVEYLKVMALPTVLAGITELIILTALFFKKLKVKITDVELDHAQIDSKLALIVGVIHLVVCLVFLIICSYISIEMWIISLVCALSLLTFTIFHTLITKRDVTHIYKPLKRLPYSLIPFFLSMFVIVVAFNYQGVSNKIAELFGNHNTIWIYGYSSFAASNIINNIPMSILYSNLCNHVEITSYYKATYASIIGSNIGAFLTPMGALAGIMFTNLLSEHDVKLTFGQFVKYGSIVALPTITVALAALFITL